jgi:hypothetical protein
MIPAQRRSCSVPLCDKNGPFVTSGLIDPQGLSRITEIAKHQRVAEAAVIAPTPPDHGDIGLAECAVAHQLTRIGRWIEQRGDLGFGQLRSGASTVSPRTLRPADQPIRAGESMSVLHRMPHMPHPWSRRRRAKPDTLSCDFPGPTPERSQFVRLCQKNWPFVSSAVVAPE